MSDRTNPLVHSVEYMASLDWVEKIIVLSTVGGPLLPEGISDKVIHRWANFGTSRAKSVAEGGFDQVTARNVAVTLAEAMGTEWLLQCDSDEIYLDHTKELLKVKADYVWLACYSFVNPTTYINAPIHPRLKLVDPHPRLFKPGMRFVANTDRQFMKTSPNHTNHCVLEMKSIHREYRTKPGVLYHLHFKPMLRGQTHQKLKTVGNVVPASYLEKIMGGRNG